MQELLENIDLFISQGMSYSEWKKLTYSGKTSIERYLDIEKSFLIKTHGNKKVYDSQIDPTIVTGEEWYNKTFKTKERWKDIGINSSIGYYQIGDRGYLPR